MPMFRTKPAMVEAIQWVDSPTEEELAASKRFFHGTNWYNNFDNGISLNTIDGKTLTAAPGDWIVKNAKGETFPCKPEAFAETYEAVEG